MRFHNGFLLSAVFIISVVSYNICSAQINEQWHLFREFNEDSYFILKHDNQQHLYLAGERENTLLRDSALIVCLNSNGSTRWVDTITAPNDYSSKVSDIAISSVNEIYLTGWYDSICTNKSFIVKYDSLGNINWERRNPFMDAPCINSQMNSALPNSLGQIVFLESSELANGIRVGETTQSGNTTLLNQFPDYNLNFQRTASSLGLDETNNIYFVADSIIDLFHLPYRIFKLNPSGNLLWSSDSTLSSQNVLRPMHLVIDSNNSTLVLLHNYTTDINGIIVSQDFELLKFNSAGNVQWDKFLITSDSIISISSIQTDALENVIISGSVSINATSVGFLMKLDSMGSEQWTKYHGDTVFSSSNKQISVDQHNKIYVANTEGGGKLLKYDEFGNLIWTYDFPNLFYFNLNEDNLIVDDSFNIYVFGQYNDVPEDSIGTMIVKLSQPGLVGLNEIEIPTSFSISPNPFTTRTTITFQNSKSLIQNLELQLFDVLGKKYFTDYSISNNSFILKRNDLPSGIYFFRILSENEILVSGKIVAQ